MTDNTKATIEIPAGMTAEQLQKLITGYQEKRVKNSTRGKAHRQALTELKKLHQEEFDTLVKKFMPKAE